MITTSEGLKKPELTDDADLQVFVADNMDLLNSMLLARSLTTHNHAGTYEPADSTILKDIDINVTIQGYNANRVIDASYVHTDNNYTTTEKNKLAGIATGANNYTHPTYAGDDFSLDTGSLSGATVIDDIDINITTDASGHVTDVNGTVATRNLTAANIGAAPTSHTHSYNPTFGTNSDINTAGATIIDNIYLTNGVMTSHGTRTLTPGDIGTRKITSGTANPSGGSSGDVYMQYE